MSATIYLVEELGDARLLCDQLQRQVDRAVQLIEKSEKKDHFFEAAGDLIQAIPETTQKLFQALQAVALATNRLDYEEVKQTLRPEKADELENVLDEVRIRPVRRRGNNPMKPEEAIQQLRSLSAVTKEAGVLPISSALQFLNSLEAGQKTAAAEDIASELSNLADALEQPPEGVVGPSRIRLAAIVRQVVAKALTEDSVLAYRVASSAWSKKELEEMMHMLKSKGYDPKDAQKLQKEGIGPNELETRLKVKPGDRGSLEYTHNFKAREAKELGIREMNLLKKYLEDILVEAKKSKDDSVSSLAQKALSQIKIASSEKAAEVTRQEWQSALESDKEMLKKYQEDLHVIQTGGKIDNLTEKGAKAVIEGLKTVIKSKESLLSKVSSEEDKSARYEEGKPADPTENMDPDDAKKWKENTEEYGDKFKTAATDRDLESDNMTGPIIRTLKAAYQDGLRSPGVSKEEAEAEVDLQVDELRDLLKMVSVRKPANPLRTFTEIAIPMWQLAYYLGIVNKTGPQKSASEEDKSARYEEGKPADPTENMDPDDAKKWKENTEEYGDKFKTAKAIQWIQKSDHVGARWVTTTLDAMAGTWHWTIQEIGGPGIPLYRVSVVSPSGHNLKWKRQPKTFNEATKFVESWAKSAASGASLDLTSEFVRFAGDLKEASPESRKVREALAKVRLWEGKLPRAQAVESAIKSVGLNSQEAESLHKALQTKTASLVTWHKGKHPKHPDAALWVEVEDNAGASVLFVIKEIDGLSGIGYDTSVTLPGKKVLYYRKQPTTLLAAKEVAEEYIADLKSNPFKEVFTLPGWVKDASQEDSWKADSRPLAKEAGSLYDKIKKDSEVVIVDSHGKKSTGVATSKTPAGWVLDMAGARSNLASPDNVVQVKQASIEKTALGVGTWFISDSSTSYISYFYAFLQQKNHGYKTIRVDVGPTGRTSSPAIVSLSGGDLPIVPERDVPQKVKDRAQAAVEETLARLKQEEAKQDEIRQKAPNVTPPRVPSKEEVSTLFVFMGTKPAYRDQVMHRKGLGSYNLANIHIASLLKRGILKLVGGKALTLEKDKAMAFLKEHKESFIEDSSLMSDAPFGLRSKL